MSDDTVLVPVDLLRALRDEPCGNPDPDTYDPCECCVFLVDAINRIIPEPEHDPALVEAVRVGNVDRVPCDCADWFCRHAATEAIDAVRAWDAEHAETVQWCEAHDSGVDAGEDSCWSYIYGGGDRSKWCQITTRRWVR